MLKSALVELAESDREFFIALLSDTLAHALAVPNAAAPANNKKTTRRKPLPSKVVPSYQQSTAAMRQDFAINKSALLSLRELFADAPKAESIIATLTK
ncbi:MAG: hypothetical protein ACKVT2_03635 [Saprospiraceae bacterium]